MPSPLAGPRAFLLILSTTQLIPIIIIISRLDRGSSLKAGAFLVYTDLGNAEEKTWEFHSVIIPQIGSGFICFPMCGWRGGSAKAVKFGRGHTAVADFCTRCPKRSGKFYRI